APDPSHAQQRHYPSAVARKQLVQRNIAADAGAAGKRMGDEVHLPLDPRSADSLVVEVALFVEQPDQSRSEIFEAASGILAGDELGTGVRQQPVRVGLADALDQLVAER